jgi:hypothetical protein
MNRLPHSPPASCRVAVALATGRAVDRAGRALVAAAMLGALVAGCSDPLRDENIALLGDEHPNFPPSEIHRPGQPCVACHSPYFGAEPIMSLGGTLFTDPVANDGELNMVPDHTIRIIDSEGKILDIKTNRCGNFYFTKEQFDPAFPLRAELRGPGTEDGATIPINAMASRIGREGSCGACHAFPASSLSPGVVFVPNGRLSPMVVLPDAGACPPPTFAPNKFDPSQQQQ